MSDPFIAEVRIWALNFAPRGWAFCHGQLLPIAQNTALFSLIGTTYGGDGRTTMGLPDFQSRVPMHPGRGPGLTDRRLGEKGGREQETLTAQQLPGHTHTMVASTDGADQNQPAANRVPGRTGFGVAARSITPDTDSTASAGISSRKIAVSWAV